MSSQFANAFTVDLEDWFHGLTSSNRFPENWSKLESRVNQNTQYLLKILNEYGVKATFFVLGEVAAQYPALIQHIESDGHEIGVHGNMHRMVHRLTPTEFEAELDQTLRLLKPLVKDEIIGHRAPYFSIREDSLWALDILYEYGFKYDSSFFPTRNMLYGYPNAPRFPHRIPTSNDIGMNGSSEITEFPLSTARYLGITWPVAGGFYLRALPHSLMRRAINRLNRQAQPAIIYMHPWELDTNQPMQAASLRERITHYHGRKGLETKLRQILQEFCFVRLRDLLEYLPVSSSGMVDL